jgi:hypothetical protein
MRFFAQLRLSEPIQLDAIAQHSMLVTRGAFVAAPHKMRLPIAKLARIKATISSRVSAGPPA